MKRSPLVALLFAWFMAQAMAEDRYELTAQVDALIDAQLTATETIPTQEVNDYQFARRATLDLAGRIPTLTELTGFVDQSSPDKRIVLVDRLLDSPEFSLHLRDTLDLLLLAPLKQDSAWREYLLEATRENRPWDRVFREILLPERERPQDKRPATFLHVRAKELDTLTNDVSSLLFGVNIACAKCHDHPLVDDWQQQHYFGLASFFERTVPLQTGFVAEKYDGRLKFTTTAGEEHEAKFMFLSGQSVNEPPETALDAESLKGLNEQLRKAQREADAAAPPVPGFSPRSELVKLALSTDSQAWFARNMVNRTWERLLGYGLVTPLDQMHSENPASHPELLELLSQDFIAQGYDLKRLIRTIVLTRTYARSSHWLNSGDPPPPEAFARGLVRPLTPRQLSLSLTVASRHPERFVVANDAPDWEKRRQELSQASEAFVNRFAIPTDGFQVSTDEALRLSNSREFQTALLDPTEDGDRLVCALLEIEDPDALIDTAFLAVISRRATAEERGALRLYLAQRADQRQAAIQHIIWALLASPEMRFNH